MPTCQPVQVVGQLVVGALFHQCLQQQGGFLALLVEQGPHLAQEGGGFLGIVVLAAYAGLLGLLALLLVGGILLHGIAHLLVVQLLVVAKGDGTFLGSGTDEVDSLKEGEFAHRFAHQIEGFLPR